MVKKRDKSFIPLAIAAVITAIMLLSPISLMSDMHCECGGCCSGCPGDCTAFGAPLPLYYFGTNDITGVETNEFFIPGAIVNFVVWIVLMATVRKFVCKR